MKAVACLSVIFSSTLALANSVSFDCKPVEGLNRASISGDATISDDGQVVEGSMDIVLKRQGDNYEEVQIGDIGFRGLVESVVGLPDSSGSDVQLTGLLINQLNSSKVEFVKVGLGLNTVNATGFVRDSSGVKYFSNCRMQIK